MTNRDEGRDFIPRTPTVRALEHALSGGGVGTIASGKPDPHRYKEIPIDPDAPDAPVCSGRKYIVADPDDPNAPHCKPKRYIVAPDTAPGSVTKSGERVAWATELGEALVERFK